MCLGTTANTDDNTLIRAYTKQVDDDPVNRDFYLECLQDIALISHSRMLHDHVDRELSKGAHTRFQLEKAFKILEIDSPATIDEEGLMAVYHSRCIEVPGRDGEFKRALDVIHHFREKRIANTGHQKKGIPSFEVVLIRNDSLGGLSEVTNSGWECA